MVPAYSKFYIFQIEFVNFEAPILTDGLTATARSRLIRSILANCTLSLCFSCMWIGSFRFVIAFSLGGFRRVMRVWLIVGSGASVVIVVASSRSSLTLFMTLLCIYCFRLTIFCAL